MASISLSRIPGRGKQGARLRGARGPPPSPGLGLRVLVFVDLVPRAPANGLPNSHHDSYQKASSMRPMHNCPSYGTHWLTTILTALNRRRRHCSARGPSSVHTWVREK